MESKDWAQYIEATDGISKPWLLRQWRLKLLRDQRATLDLETCLAELRQAWMNLGEWGQGQESAVFGTGNLPGESR